MEGVREESHDHVYLIFLLQTMQGQLGRFDCRKTA